MNQFKQSARPRRRKKEPESHKLPMVIKMRLWKALSSTDQDAPSPSQLLLIRGHENDSSTDQLFIDQVPLPREAWTFDKRERILSWHHLYGGGRLYIAFDSNSCTGVVGNAVRPVAVQGSSQAQFTCDVALNCGVGVVMSGNSIESLTYDPASAAWRDADWVPDRLQLTYTCTYVSKMLPPEFAFEFADLETDGFPWQPDKGSFTADLYLDQVGDGPMVWELYFHSDSTPPPDRGFNPPTGPKTVFPFRLEATEDSLGLGIAGAMLTEAPTDEGVKVGIQGVQTSNFINGYYLAKGSNEAFGIFNGKMVINGKPVPHTYVGKKGLHYKNLGPDLQKRLGLPASGLFQFNGNGHTGTDESNNIKISRLSATNAIAYLKQAASLHPDIAQTLHTIQQDQVNPSLNIIDLLNMTPYRYVDNGWTNVVQDAVTDDMGIIMNSFIDPTMWNLLFPGQAQPVLSGNLARIANSPVPGVSDPTAWYTSLSTAVLTSGMANSDNKNAVNMNGPRASAWLQSEVSTSKVYYYHAQQLFADQWNYFNNSFPLFLQDQIDNAEAYNVEIDEQTEISKNDILANVSTNGASDPKLIPDLIANLEEMGQYAKDNKLYWAFATYTYVTSATMFSNVQLQLSRHTGNTEGSTLSRWFQQYSTVLTALDPSGYFAQKFNADFNLYLSTNIMPTLYGFNGDAMDFDLIRDYLQTFVDENINNEDAQIQKAAAEIQAIIDGENGMEILRESIAVIQEAADIIDDVMALPYVTQYFIKWAENKFPSWTFTAANMLGGLLVMGMASMGAFAMYYDFTNWKNLSTEERAELVTNVAQMGLQIAGSIAKRGVRAWLVATADGLAPGQRVAATFNVLWNGKTNWKFLGDSEILDDALLNTGSKAAKWVASSETGLLETLAEDGSLTVDNVLEVASSFGEDDSWIVTIFGKNLDTFIATRICSVFIIAGMGYTIYAIATGDSGIELGADIASLVSGALSLLAIAGEWAVSEALIDSAGWLAAFCTVAGPLAIVAALAGLALMLWNVFRKKPDPVAEFVNQYVKQAGFYVTSKDSAIDYVTLYKATDQNNLMMVGFTLGTGAQCLCANNDGSIGLGSTDYMPAYVWLVKTDGVGLSQIFAVVQPAGTTGTVQLLLSLMKDNTISFQPVTNKPGDKNDVVTQSWYTTPTSNAVLANDGANLQSLSLQFQPVIPHDGTYDPEYAQGYMVQTTTGVAYSLNGPGTSFQLTMSAVAPNYMQMVNLNFKQNTIPSELQKWGPTFGLFPSTPLTFALNNQLPDFLTFNTGSGEIQPNGQEAMSVLRIDETMTASNAKGSANATFTINVAPVGAAQLELA